MQNYIKFCNNKVIYNNEKSVVVGCGLTAKGHNRSLEGDGKFYCCDSHTTLSFLSLSLLFGRDESILHLLRRSKITKSFVKQSKKSKKSILLNSECLKSHLCHYIWIMQKQKFIADTYCLVWIYCWPSFDLNPVKNDIQLIEITFFK